MKDLIALVGIPLLLLGILLVYVIRQNHRLALSNTPNARIKKTIMHPRVIRDINHQLTSMNELMVVEQSEEFNADVSLYILTNVRRGMKKNGDIL